MRAVCMALLSLTSVFSKYEAVVLVVRRNEAWRVDALSTIGT